MADEGIDKSLNSYKIQTGQLFHHSAISGSAEEAKLRTRAVHNSVDRQEHIKRALRSQVQRDRGLTAQ